MVVVLFAEVDDLRAICHQFQGISDEIPLHTISSRHVYSALLHAAQDSLQATQLLSNDANAYILTGECLAKLRKLKECVN